MRLFLWLFNDIGGGRKFNKSKVDFIAIMHIKKNKD